MIGREFTEIYLFVSGNKCDLNPSRFNPVVSI